MGGIGYELIGRKLGTPRFPAAEGWRRRCPVHRVAMHLSTRTLGFSLATSGILKVVRDTRETRVTAAGSQKALYDSRLFIPSATGVAPRGRKGTPRSGFDLPQPRNRAPMDRLMTPGKGARPVRAGVRGQTTRKLSASMSLSAQFRGGNTLSRMRGKAQKPSRIRTAPCSAWPPPTT